MASNSNMKTRLIVMNFLEFAIWGCYLVSMGIYLGNSPDKGGAGLGAYVYLFYTAQGLVSLFMPALVGIIADKWVPAQKMLSICHGISATFMLLVGWYCWQNPGNVQFSVIFTFYTLAIAFFMPTIGLANSVAFNALNKAGLDTVTAFPPIRVFGTVGFICAELFVNFTDFQSSYMQFVSAGVIGLLLMIYALTMPECPVNKGDNSQSISEKLGLSAFSLFRNKTMAIFFIFSMLLGVCLQITNSYGTMFIASFQNIAEFANSWGAKNATALTAISQASEALCILLIPMCLKRFGIKGVMLMAMLAWVIRFGFFGIGNTGSGIVFIIISCIVYGVAFDFFNVAGGLFVDQQTDVKMRSSAQGLFMIMTNGIGASVGTFIAGNYVVNKFVDMSANANAETNLAGWQTSWFIFAGYALTISILFYFIFRTPTEAKQPPLKKEEVQGAMAIAAGEPEGMVEEK
ncbi:MAG: MFS transporter [Muribaculaceae bacterium]|nr:MFS transporter [Muribaculaceae bacterium]